MADLKQSKNREEAYRFFSHTKCEYFPCHQTSSAQDFNCLFCYCPLYAFGRACGGNYTYTENGYKDCSGCMIPHRREGYDYVVGKYDELITVMRNQEMHG